jgi:hypothetical protein
LLVASMIARAHFAFVPLFSCFFFCFCQKPKNIDRLVALNAAPTTQATKIIHTYGTSSPSVTCRRARVCLTDEGVKELRQRGQVRIRGHLFSRVLAIFRTRAIPTNRENFTQS